MKLPPSAKRVFKGVIFEVHQWDQEMFDGRHETFEMLKRPDTVQVIATQGDDIILIADEQPGKPVEMTFPGGRVDEEELPLDAAKRELLEELGLASDDWELYVSYDPFLKMQWTIYYFIARDCQRVAEPHLDEGGERIEPRPVSFDAFMDIATSKELNAGEFTSDMLRLLNDDKKLDEFKELLFKK